MSGDGVDVDSTTLSQFLLQLGRLLPYVRLEGQFPLLDLVDDLLACGVPNLSLSAVPQ